MPGERTGAGRAFALRNLAGSVTVLWVHLGLLLTDSVLVNAQLNCSSEECEPLQSTLSTQSKANERCYSVNDTEFLFCNPGFRLSGENYTATCSARGVWTPNNSCRIDLFIVFVATSASMVAILIFFLCFLCIYNWRCVPGKRKEHNVSKVKAGKKKKRARAKADPEAANGHVDEFDEFDDDFTDDEEEVVVPKRNTQYDDNVYQNHTISA